MPRDAFVFNIQRELVCHQKKNAPEKFRDFRETGSRLFSQSVAVIIKVYAVSAYLTQCLYRFFSFPGWPCFPVLNALKSMGTKFEVLYVGWEDHVKFSEVVKILFLCLADKDVARTDRQTDFYSEANHPNLTKLYDILLTYCMYNFDLGES